MIPSPFARVILASASPRRKLLLSGLGVPFEVVVSDAEELHDPGLELRRLCEENARAKAAVVAAAHPDALVIGADTLVARGGRLYGKPRDLAEARLMLEELQGGDHEVVTGVALLGRAGGVDRRFSVTTVVTFKVLAREEIEDYLARTQPLDKAGAYGIQDHGDRIVAGINGSFSNVVGLPLEQLEAELVRLGVGVRRAPGNGGAD